MPGSGYVAYRTVREKEERGEALDEVQQRQIEVGRAAMEGRADNVRRFLELGMLPRLVISSDAGPFDIEFGKLYQGLGRRGRAG